MLGYKCEASQSFYAESSYFTALLHLAAVSAIAAKKTQTLFIDLLCLRFLIVPFLLEEVQSGSTKGGKRDNTNEDKAHPVVVY